MTMPQSNSVVDNSIDRAAFEDFYASASPTMTGGATSAVCREWSNQAGGCS